jgi:hypothetical protein
MRKVESGAVSTEPRLRQQGGWLSLCDTATNAKQEIEDWFLPELVDPVGVTKLADGLRPRDGYEVHYAGTRRSH